MKASMLTGALFVIVSTLIFIIVHNIFISNTWFMLLPMLAAGALCGALVRWRYRLLAVIPSKRSRVGGNPDRIVGDRRRVVWTDWVVERCLCNCISVPWRGSQFCFAFASRNHLARHR